MSDNDQKTIESSNNPSQRRSNNKNQRATVGRGIKNCMDAAIVKSNIDGDPTRSDE
jgi:hypothetical protein